MIDPASLSQAFVALSGPVLSIADAEREVPGSPGLYAVHARPEVWSLLGLGQAPDDRPLYVGKAERSLSSRDIRTHFATGKTGSSTLRRSLAGLLADELDLHGQPRNLAKPESFANFGLEASGDARLTEWMHQQLLIAVWPSPDDVVLDEIETAVLERLLPPLNLDKVSTPWRPLVRAGRKRLADQARAWVRPAVVTSRQSVEEERPSSAPVSSRSGRVVGIDAAGKHGWVGVLVDGDGFQGAHLGSLCEVVAWAEPVEVIGVDIPIGQVEDGSRAADSEARAFVGPRSSSVFPSPPTEALAAGSYEEANRTLTGLGLPMLSRQAWALIPKITEAAEFADDDDRVFEVHPEVSFCELAGQHLAWPKKSWNGLLLRRRLLAEAGIVLPDVMPEVAGVVADDVVDAAVVAWTARRIAAGVARTLPDPPEQSDDRAVAIWC